MEAAADTGTASHTRAPLDGDGRTRRADERSVTVATVEVGSASLERAVRGGSGRKRWANEQVVERRREASSVWAGGGQVSRHVSKRRHVSV